MFNKLNVIYLSLFLTGCQVFAGMSVHDTSFDSEYQEDGIIAVIGITEDINKNIEVFIEHHSMPRFSEKIGHGTNQIGIKFKTGKL